MPAVTVHGPHPARSAGPVRHLGAGIKLTPGCEARPLRAARRAGTAAAVARLHYRHPHLTAASIGERLGVSERTVPVTTASVQPGGGSLPAGAAYGAVLAGAVLLSPA